MTVSPARTADPGPLSYEEREISSYALDAWFDDPAILTDAPALRSVLRAAAAAGGATVLDESSATFPNGAVTAVLLLAESHLSVHTWPEHRVATFDLLTCGRMRGEQVLDHLDAALRPAHRRVTKEVRELRRPAERPGG